MIKVDQLDTVYEEQAAIENFIFSWRMFSYMITNGGLTQFIQFFGPNKPMPYKTEPVIKNNNRDFRKPDEFVWVPPSFT